MQDIVESQALELAWLKPVEAGSRNVHFHAIAAFEAFERDLDEVLGTGWGLLASLVDGSLTSDRALTVTPLPSG